MAAWSRDCIQFLPFSSDTPRPYGTSMGSHYTFMQMHIGHSQDHICSNITDIVTRCSKSTRRARFLSLQPENKCPVGIPVHVQSEFQSMSSRNSSPCPIGIPVHVQSEFQSMSSRKSQTQKTPEGLINSKQSELAIEEPALLPIETHAVPK